MNAYLILVGSLACAGRYMLATELLEASLDAQKAASEYLAAKWDRLAGCNLVTVAAIYYRDSLKS